MYRACSGRIRAFSARTRNLSYTLPTIPTLENARVAEAPFQGLFSSKAVNELWFKRGQQLIDQLNHLIEENNIEGDHGLNELIALSFHKPELAGVHSRASLLHNLQFFFESVKPGHSSQHVCKVPESALLKTPDISQQVQNEPTDNELRQWILDSFGSMVEFRTLLLNSANGIKGDGTTWLVARANQPDLTYRSNAFRGKKEVIYSNLAVVNTYNAGSVDDSIRSGRLTKLGQQKAARLALENKEETPSKDQSDSLRLGTVEEAEAATVFSDRKLVPLLAIDASSRNYLLDYGVFGKEEYLDNVWKCIDWDVVQARAPSRFKQSFELD